MPGTHSPKSIHWFTLDGNVRTSGGAKNLAKGQFAIVESGKATADGALVVGSFAGKPQSAVYEMRLGRNPLPENRSFTSKAWTTQPFTIKDVVSVKANYPEVTEQTFDDLIIGYDGINAATAITLEENQTTLLDVVLEGNVSGYYTGSDKYIATIHFGKEEGETNQEVVRRAVKNLKQQILPGSVKITDVVDISVVDSTNPGLTGTPYVFSTLTVVDSGDSNALGRVQAQYPAYKVVRTDVAGDASVYTILHPASQALAAYNNQNLAYYIKGCEDCIAGYSELTGGVVYSVSIEDDGIDLSTTVDNLPGYVASSIIRHGVKNGKGLYTLVTDNALTEAEITTYVTTAGVQTTAEIKMLGDVKDVCTDDLSTTVAWVDGDTCYASQDIYSIQLKDNDCGESRLAELQAAYPALTIEEGAPSGAASQTVTLTGTSGTANINVGGNLYLATFTTNLTTTATNFVTAHAAAILADTGITVTANAAVLTFAGQENDGFPVSIANVTTNLAGTVSALDIVTAPSVGGCQRVYTTTVTTDVVCDECSDIFLNQFMSEAPTAYQFTDWELYEPASNPAALMGIRITGKPLIWYPGEAMRDMVPFYETSVRIKVAGGYIEEPNFSFEPQYSDIFNVKRLSIAQDRDNLGGHLMQWEDASVAHHEGRDRSKELYKKFIFGDESTLKYSSQYISFELGIDDHKPSQGFGKHSDIGITVIIWAELGYHENLQTLVNSLAAKAGLDGVRPVVIP